MLTQANPPMFDFRSFQPMYVPRPSDQGWTVLLRELTCKIFEGKQSTFPHSVLVPCLTYLDTFFIVVGLMLSEEIDGDIQIDVRRRRPAANSFLFVFFAPTFFGMMQA